MISMFKKNPIFYYESAIDTYPNIITPAKNHIPEWYKKIPKWKNNEIVSKEKKFGHSVKQCIPLLDSLTSGYMVVLPYDIYVKDDSGLPYLTWRDGGVKYPITWRNEVADLNLVPTNHYPLEYTWHFGASYTVSSKYSMLVTHPLNRFDLPFTTLSGIIDGNVVMPPTGNIPFYIKKGFEGIIHQGTPIAQIIPFLQENWNSKNKSGLIAESQNQTYSANSVISGFYKKNFWKRKKYD